jgi:Sulfotransferase domain
MLQVFKRYLYSRLLKYKKIRIVSYPKSGRTWVRLMLGDLNVYPRFTHTKAGYIFNDTPYNIDDTIPKFYSKRVVFLIRDPRDTVVSQYFHLTKITEKVDKSLKEFIRDPYNGFERVVVFNKKWCESKDKFKDFLMVSYEDLKLNPIDGLERILNFLNLPFIRKKDIVDVVRNNEFQKMQQREISGELHDAHGDRFAEDGGKGKEGLKVRRGKVGGYVDYFDEKDIEYCEKILSQYNYSEDVKIMKTNSLPDSLRHP